MGRIGRKRISHELEVFVQCMSAAEKGHFVKPLIELPTYNSSNMTLNLGPQELYDVKINLQNAQHILLHNSSSGNSRTVFICMGKGKPLAK